ncbi:hypothetical protein N7462_002301 [Penicillium macrosclerotiorum]|uniref:uncharacterized protein n=1 Tax=Penicillium macrosclerotiorum TaxID=303699 RepID=UPI0025491377|nr:uncharacterized protein N7462_002301 [Penicillium macrosclerotiorum]KAJ5692878.1 hypothetical protein N7462_002301 [Penicillium macrosclerotiorum]
MSTSTPYFRPAAHAQGLANYPHARTVAGPSGHGAYIYVSGTSSRRGDGSFAGASRGTDGTMTFDIRAQTEAVLANIDAIIQGASEGRASIRDVVDATVFLTDMKGDYAGMNEEWNRVWPDREAAPARTTVEVRALPREEILVEIKCTVYYV